MEISDLDRRVAPVYNELVIAQTDIYLHMEPPGLDMRNGERAAWKKANEVPPHTGDMDHNEFVQYNLESNRQPINPVALAREALGYDETATGQDIMIGLQAAFFKLKQQYRDNNVDPTHLTTAFEIIHLTEAYIAGYSREVDQVAQRLKAASPSEDEQYTGLERWNELWVPDEDMHDEVETYLATSVPGLYDMEQFFDDHIRHMKIGNHVDLSGFIGPNAYVTLQEDATVINYDNAVKIFGPVFGHIMARLAADEARHKRAYRGVHLGLTEAFPDETVLATRKVIDEFGMPGEKGIRKFKTRAGDLGRLGLLDPAGLLDSQSKLLEAMEMDKLKLETDAAKIACYELLTGQNEGTIKLTKANELIEKMREKALQKAEEEGSVRPLIIEETVTSDPKTGELVFLLAA